MKMIGFIIMFFMILSLSLRSQELKDTVKLNTVVVRSRQMVAERGLFTHSIDTMALASASNTNISDLLLKNSSLYLKSYGNGGLATASFRGTSASHTQVLWNGLNINSPLGGQTDLSLIPVFFVDEVSIYYGSSSLMKTTGGLGGCISMSNTPVWNKGNTITFTQGAGSYGYILSQLRLGVSHQKFITNTRVFLEKAKNNFRYYDNMSGLFDYTRQKNASYFKDGLLQEFYLKINKRQFVGLKFIGTWNDRNLPPIMSYQGPIRTENQKDRLLSVQGEWKGYFNNINLSCNSGYNQSILNYLLLLPDSSDIAGGNYNTKSISNQLFNKINLVCNLSDVSVLKFSTDLVYTQASYQDKYENSSGFNVDRTEATVQSSFHHAFNSRFSAYGLAGQKILNREFLPFVFGAGSEYKINRSGNLILITNLGRNIHIPNLNDIYFSYGANRSLKPEIGYQGDAGMTYASDRNGVNYKLEFTVFSAWVKNWILWQPTGYGLWTARNVQQVFSRGAEFTGNLEGKLGSVNYILKGNYSFTRTTNEVKSTVSYGMQLIYIPRHVGNLQLNLEKWGYNLLISGHYTGSRYASSAEENAHLLPAYYVQDISLGKNFKIREFPLDINFRLNNIFNKQYQVVQQRAMPGINFNLTLSTNI